MNQFNEADQAAGAMANPATATIEISEVLAELNDDANSMNDSFSMVDGSGFNGDGSFLGSLTASFGIYDSITLYQRRIGEGRALEHSGNEGLESILSQVGTRGHSPSPSLGSDGMMALFDIRDSTTPLQPADGVQNTRVINVLGSSITSAANDVVHDDMSLDGVSLATQNNSANISDILMSIGNDSISVSFGINDSLQVHQQGHHRRGSSGSTFGSFGSYGPFGIKDSIQLRQQGHHRRGSSGSTFGSFGSYGPFGIRDSLKLVKGVHRRGSSGSFGSFGGSLVPSATDTDHEPSFESVGSGISHLVPTKTFGYNSQSSLGTDTPMSGLNDSVTMFFQQRVETITEEIHDTTDEESHSSQSRSSSESINENSEENTHERSREHSRRMRSSRRTVTKNNRNIVFDDVKFD